MRYRRNTKSPDSPIALLQSILAFLTPSNPSLDFSFLFANFARHDRIGILSSACACLCGVIMPALKPAKLLDMQKL